MSLYLPVCSGSRQVLSSGQYLIAAITRCARRPKSPCVDVIQSCRGWPYRVAFLLMLVTTLPLICSVPLEASGVKNHVWLDTACNPLPFQTDAAIEDFLLAARVTSMTEIPLGVTNAKKVVLERERIQAHGVFRDVEIRKQTGPGRKGRQMLNFRDSCVYECAAYQLSRLLGLNNVPPVVRRKIEGQGGTLQIFIENAVMDKTLSDEGRKPPNRWRSMMQNQVLAIFDNLIYNDDRNHGNVLYDKQWNLWMIDHTRAFRVFQDLPEPKNILYCERRLWERLQTIEDNAFRSRLADLLTEKETNALLARRKELIEHIAELIEKKGEKKVLFDFF